ncbi:hypothetical protein [Psychromicrobium sp. YIM B11713]|uniref:hypothetical protein n=1 Tax=Psychromicrobium sp. YIM B11713 TaxID=3145233 RepID=UPI00374F5A05
MVERLFRSERFDVLTVPADWTMHGKMADILLKQQIVDLAVDLLCWGSEVLCMTFLDLCRDSKCTWSRHEQLMPHIPGHFSHGTIHCRTQVIRAGLETVNVIQSSLSRF